VKVIQNVCYPIPNAMTRACMLTKTEDILWTVSSSIPVWVVTRRETVGIRAHS